MSLSCVYLGNCIKAKDLSVATGWAHERDIAEETGSKGAGGRYAWGKTIKKNTVEQSATSFGNNLPTLSIPLITTYTTYHIYTSIVYTCPTKPVTLCGIHYMRAWKVFMNEW